MLKKSEIFINSLKRKSEFVYYHNDKNQIIVNTKQNEGDTKFIRKKLQRKEEQDKTSSKLLH